MTIVRDDFFRTIGSADFASPDFNPGKKWNNKGRVP